MSRGLSLQTMHSCRLSSFSAGGALNANEFGLGVGEPRRLSSRVGVLVNLKAGEKREELNKLDERREEQKTA